MDPTGKERYPKPKWLIYLTTLTALTLVTYHLIAAGYKPLPGIQHRAIHIGLGFILIWLVFPISSRLRGNRIAFWVDLAFAFITAIITIYVFHSFTTYADRVGLPPTTPDIILGIITILFTLEVARRTTGWVFPMITVGFLLFAIFGPYIPEPFAHGGLNIPRIVSSFFLTLEGTYGFITGVSANYILIFIVLAAVIRYTAAGQFIMDFTMSIIGKVRGGPAKMAVVASALMGTITGSSMANVAGTGSFTIPLMKSLGYRKEFAGGVEASASMGAQIMPPVMGGSIFIMMEILGVPYWDICVAAFPMAILFFIGLFIAVDYEAIRLNLIGFSRKDLPSFFPTLRSGWYLMLPILTLVYMLVKGVTPQRAGFTAILIAIVTGIISKRNRLNWRKLIAAIEMGAKDALVVIGIVGAASLIQGIVSVTGLGLNLSNILVELSGGNLFVLLLLTAITSLILGMGLPIIVCYTLLSMLVAPALIKLGVLPLAAHLFIFYYGVISAITPPVAPDAFVASGIAGADPYKVAVEAVLIALPIYLIPFFFVYNPIFILRASTPWLEFLWVFLTGIAGVYALASGLQGYMLKNTRLNITERSILVVTAILLIAPLKWESLFALVILIVIQTWAFLKGKRQTPQG
ncbi:MAG: TRAP transporter permease [Deltaproteobacteria bacterium]|nr:TRAP transporter permease [Deltaproteobacteria bacterium]